MPRLRSEQSGFTLIEVLVALGVLVVGLLATTQVFASSDSATLDAEFQQIATEQAELAIEQVRSLDYDEIGHSATPVEATGEGRLNNPAGTFTPPGADPEELVIAANDEGGDSLNGVVGADLGGGETTQARNFDVDGISGTIYTFVTWRDEECQPLDLAGFDTALAGLQNDLTARRAQLTQLLNALTGIGGLDGFPAAKALKNSVISAMRNEIDNANTAIDALQVKLSTLNADLCDLAADSISAIDNLTDPDGIGGVEIAADLTTPLGTSGTLKSRLDANIAATTGLLGLTCTDPLLALLCGTLNSESGTTQTEIGAGGPARVTVEGISTDANGLATAIEESDTTHNTKRITVAVVVDDPRGDITPDQTLYMSSIVVDPEEGLLGA